MGILDRALRLGEAKQYKGYADRVDRINAFEPEMELLGDEELREEADKLRERARNGEPLDELLYETFALTREASKRTLGQRHFDVQMIGGIVLHDGGIAEMKTGEGEKPEDWADVDANGKRHSFAHRFAIVDEVANILIDEARTPLIISGAPEQAADLYAKFARLAPTMETGKAPEGMDARAKKDFVADFD